MCKSLQNRAKTFAYFWTSERPVEDLWSLHKKKKLLNFMPSFHTHVLEYMPRVYKIFPCSLKMRSSGITTCPAGGGNDGHGTKYWHIFLVRLPITFTWFLFFQYFFFVSCLLTPCCCFLSTIMLTMLLLSERWECKWQEEELQEMNLKIHKNHIERPPPTPPPFSLSLYVMHRCYC